MANFSLDKLLSLKQGQKFKSYRDMCEYIDAPYLKDNSRKSQIKEWEQHVKLKVNKTGSITIVEKYEKPVKKADKRENGNNRVYMNLIELLLLDYLYENIDEENWFLCLTKSNLYDILGFTNEAYLKEFTRKYKVDANHKKDVEKFKEENNVTTFDLYNFYEHSRLRFNVLLDRALEDLIGKSIVIIENVFMITEFEHTPYNEDLKIKVLDRLKNEDLNDAQIYSLLNMFECTESRLATDKEISHIINITRATLTDFDFDYIADVFRNKESSKFYKEITIKLLDELDWIFCYRARKFRFGESSLKTGIRMSERKIEDFKRDRTQLNSLMKDAVNQSAVSAYNNNIKKLEQIESDALNNILNDDKVFRFKDNYIEVRQALVEYFMSLEKDEKSKN